MVFYGPYLIALAMIISYRSSQIYLAAIYSIAVVVVAVLGFGYALAYTSVPDNDPMCQALLDRGLQQELCEGAMVWSEIGLEQRFHGLSVFDRASQVTGIVTFAAAILPLALFYMVSCERRRTFYILVASISFAAPLFVAAVDWNRWVFTYVSVLTIGTVALLHSGHLRQIQKSIPQKFFIPTLFLMLTFSMGHFLEFYLEGYLTMIENQVEKIWRVLT